MTKQYIGKKKITLAKETEEKTEGGIVIMEVVFEDETTEHFSKLMFDEIISENRYDESELREKRITPVVAVVLAVLRDWGIKTGELPYFSAVLNNSLDENQKQALTKLLSDWMPKPNSLDELDLVTIDRILREKSGK